MFFDMITDWRFYPDFANTSINPDNVLGGVFCQNAENNFPKFKGEAVELNQAVVIGIGQLDEELDIRINILIRWRWELTRDGGNAFQGYSMAN